jgi:hypothetical protein
VVFANCLTASVLGAAAIAGVRELVCAAAFSAWRYRRSA